MTADEFREIALSFSGTIESSHRNHPDFRAHGRIFATLGSPDPATGMVKLALSDQQHFVTNHPHVFYPAKGAWGLQGSTMVRLAAAEPGMIAQAIELAWKSSAQATASTPPKQSKRSRQIYRGSKIKPAKADSLWEHTQSQRSSDPANEKEPPR